jgi:glycosyltransferase involved in cell wall biosynthesis
VCGFSACLWAYRTLIFHEQKALSVSLRSLSQNCEGILNGVLLGFYTCGSELHLHILYLSVISAVKILISVERNLSMAATPNPGQLDVSVISPVFNHEETVSDTIDSVLKQKTKYNVHHYLLNDASTDDSENILKDYAGRYPGRITVLSNETNLGSGKKSLLNQKPDISSPFWCFLAGDDYWVSPKKIQRQVDLLLQYPDAVGCSSNTLMRDEIKHEEVVISPAHTNWNLMDMLLGSNYYVHPSGILWRNLHYKTGCLFPPEYVTAKHSGDTLLLFMMLFGGGSMIHLQELTSVYRVTGKGVWSQLTEDEKNSRNRQLMNYIHLNVPVRHRFARYLVASTGSSSLVPQWRLPQRLN